MIDGTYDIMIRTPMGSERGRLTLVTKGATLSGSLFAMGKNHPFSGGTVQGENCTFSTNLSTPLGRFQLFVHGSVKDGTLRAAAATPMGSITAMGRRMERRGG